MFSQIFASWLLLFILQAKWWENEKRQARRRSCYVEESLQKIKNVLHKSRIIPSQCLLNIRKFSHRLRFNIPSEILRHFGERKVCAFSDGLTGENLHERVFKIIIRMPTCLRS